MQNHLMWLRMIIVLQFHETFRQRLASQDMHNKVKTHCSSSTLTSLRQQLVRQQVALRYWKRSHQQLADFLPLATFGLRLP